MPKHARAGVRALPLADLRLRSNGGAHAARRAPRTLAGIGVTPKRAAALLALSGSVLATTAAAPLPHNDVTSQTSASGFQPLGAWKPSAFSAAAIALAATRAQDAADVAQAHELAAVVRARKALAAQLAAKRQAEAKAKAEALKKAKAAKAAAAAKAAEVAKEKAAEEAAVQRDSQRQSRSSSSASRHTSRSQSVSRSSVRTALPSGFGAQVMVMAQRYSGVRYVYGGSTPSQGFDCSGYVGYVMRQLGYSLPRSAASMYGAVQHISASQLRAGDLVFVHKGGRISHVAIYAGNGYWYEASRPGTVTGKHRAWTSSVSYGRVG